MTFKGFKDIICRCVLHLLTPALAGENLEGVMTVRFSPGVEAVVQRAMEGVVWPTVTQGLRRMFPHMDLAGAAYIVRSAVQATPIFDKGRIYVGAKVCVGLDFGALVGPDDPKLIEKALEELVERLPKSMQPHKVTRAVDCLARDKNGQPEVTAKLLLEVREEDVDYLLEKAFELARAAEEAGAPWARSVVEALELIGFPERR